MESRQVWKFGLTVTGHQVIAVPKDAEFLSVQCQRQELCLWALVEPHNIPEKRLIYIVGTGHVMPDGIKGYIGTAQMLDGSLVWHVFEGE